MADAAVWFERCEPHEVSDLHDIFRVTVHGYLHLPPGFRMMVQSAEAADALEIALAPPLGWESVAALQEAYEQALAERDRIRAGHVISVIFGGHPGAPRPFALYRPPSRTLLALGAEFPDGAVALRLANDGGWTTRSDGGAEGFAKGANEGADAEVVWLCDELEPLAAMEAERDQALAHLDRALKVVQAAQAWRAKLRSGAEVMVFGRAIGRESTALLAAVDAYTSTEEAGHG